MPYTRARYPNRDIRKRVFVALMSGEDYVDAFDRLLRLKLRGKQEREVRLPHPSLPGPLARP